MALTAGFLSAIVAAVWAGSNPTTEARKAIFVINSGGYVTIYAPGRGGDVEPIATIDGAATRIDDPQGIALDSSGKIYVLNEGEGAKNSAGVVVFAAGSKGNVSPIANISGTETGIRSPKSIAVDSNGNIYVTNEEGFPPGPNIQRPGGVTVYPAGSNGDVKPSTTIRGADVNMNLCCPCADTCCGNDTGIQNPFGIAVDSKSNIFVTSTSGCPHSQGESVRVFPAASNGNIKPSVVIVGPSTGLTGPNGIALDSGGDIYVTNFGGRARAGSVIVYRRGSSGDATPIAKIGGAKTRLHQPRSIALDSNGSIYVADVTVGQYQIESIAVFDPGSNGDIAPRSIISGDNTGLNGIAGIAIGPYSASR